MDENTLKLVNLKIMEDKQNLQEELGHLTNWSNEVGQWLVDHLKMIGMNEFFADATKIIIFTIFIILLSYLANKVTKNYIIKVIVGVVKKTRSKYDDFLIDRKVFQRLSHIVPAVIIYYSIGLVFRDYDSVVWILNKCVIVYFVFIFVWSLSSLLTALEDIYNTFDSAHERPIKGYVQILKILLYFITFLVSISIIFTVDLTAVFTGLGAVAAIILLIFKDTILGFVASIQLSVNKMVKIGDWISMPSHNADGTVLEITLNTVKVQNWDKTISTIPTYALVTNSFSNWRGMEESGGRRIKRSINLDMQSVKFCNVEMLTKFKQIEYLKEYISTMEEELDSYNKSNAFDNNVLVNGRRMTNLGVFRKYLEQYLFHHPDIHNDMTFLVRQLQPTEKGIPIEIYVFSKQQQWAKYETIQADIFDHVLAVVPEFELSVFQFPSGRDFKFSKL